MSRNQWVILVVLGLAVAMVFGCMGALVLLYLTGSFPTQTAAPVQPVDTPAPRPSNTPAPPRASAVCQSLTQDYLAEIQPLLEDWQDTLEVANSTSRIALSPVVQDMQAIRRHIADVPIPDCAQDPSGLLIIGLDDVIDSFLDFMADSNSDAAIAQKMDMGLLEMMTATDQLISLTKGMELDGDDAGYAVCAEPILGKERQLVEEVYTTSFQALDDASFVSFCRQVPGWPPQIDSLRGAYEACPTPLDPHLQAAHLWLEAAFEGGASALRSWANWCVGNAQDLPLPNLDTRYTSIVHQMDTWETAVQRAEQQIGRF